MADVFPSSLIYRENPNLRLGIKSSLNSFKQLLASLYIISLLSRLEIIGPEKARI